ncbi:hypothetical protein MTO96_045269 [Rhipicephalus appendiculatus]
MAHKIGSIEDEASGQKTPLRNSATKHLDHFSFGMEVLNTYTLLLTAHENLEKQQ